MRHNWVFSLGRDPIEFSQFLRIIGVFLKSRRPCFFLRPWLALLVIGLLHSSVFAADYSKTLIRRLAPQLSLKLEQVDDLPAPEREQLTSEYERLSVRLSSPAVVRLGNPDFWASVAENFPEISFSDVEQLRENGGKKSLGDFFEEVLRRGPLD
jgi:hypothetical protein